MDIFSHTNEIIEFESDEFIEFRVDFSRVDVKAKKTVKIKCGDENLLEELRNYKLQRVVDKYPDFLKKETVKILREAILVRKELDKDASLEEILDDILYEIFGYGILKMEKEAELSKKIIEIINKYPNKSVEELLDNF